MTRLSVVVPTLDESRRLPHLLEDLERLGDVVGEIVVVDGGSSDDTATVARRLGARVVETAPGRGSQLRAGAHASVEPWLFFVHADCRLPAQAARALLAFLETAAADDFAHFRFALDGHGGFARFIELGQRLRERLYGLVYGDQGLVVSRTLYDRAGGHPEWPLMEDVGIVDRLERSGRRVALDAPLPTSDRRYRREGGVRAWLRNVVLITRFRMGTPPERLVRWYPPEATGRTRSVAVFAKAPFPGQVKTRLAADVGDDEAVRIYRRIGSETVDAIRRGPWRTRIWVASDDAVAHGAVEEWLGLERTALHSQAGADLGARMDGAIRAELADAAAVVVVGSDIPGIDEGTLRMAFASLDDADVVVGPANDGGYYLIGMKAPYPELFVDIPWSTGEVLDRTRAAAERSGLSLALLEAKTDVDTVADLPAGYGRS